jgi:hypothetical protein
MAALAARSARRRDRQSIVGGGIEVDTMAGQLKLIDGYWDSRARRVAWSKGSRPTFTPGGVRNQYNSRENDLPPRVVTSTRYVCS